MKKGISLAFLLLFFIAINAQQNTESASSILTAAYKKASAENKNVIVIFHASWCGWCRKMDASISDEKCKKIFDANYVIVHLTVEESPDKKNLENSGAAELKKKYLGENAGLPFWIILDKNGNLLADSYLRKKNQSSLETGDNTGCPSQADEVAYFISVLKKTSSISDNNLSVIAKRFRENDVK